MCVSSARTDLCGGRSAMIVPSATRFPDNLSVYPSLDWLRPRTIHHLNRSEQYCPFACALLG